MVQFPLGDELQNVVINSPVNNKLEKIKTQIIYKFFSANSDSIVLCEADDMIYDHIHLNTNGLNLVTEKLSREINSLAESKFIIVELCHRSLSSIN